MRNISAATCSENYDFVLTDDGHLSVEETTVNSLANMLRLDFNSNDDWGLDADLGVHWLTTDNTGLLQVKGSEAQIVSAVQRKLINIEGVKLVESIDIARGINRALYLKVVVISDSGESIILEKEVK